MANPDNLLAEERKTLLSVNSTENFNLASEAHNNGNSMADVEYVDDTPPPLART